MIKRSFWLSSGALLIGLAAACASEDSNGGSNGGSGAFPGKGGSSGSGWGGSSGSTNCSRAGRPCQAKNDCCSGLTCRFSRCCAPSGDSCTASNECCDSDHACIDNVCTPTSSGKGGSSGSTGGSSAGGASGEGGSSTGGAGGEQCLPAWENCTAGSTACCAPANCVDGMCCGDTGDGCKIDDDCCWLKDTCQGGKCTETASGGTGGGGAGGSSTGGSGGACTPAWNDCQKTAECCNGSCNEGLCCSSNGDGCASDDDCCFNSLKCVNKMCQTSGTGGSGGASCGIYFAPCQSTFECCTGLTCKTSYCCADTNEICGVDIDCCNLADTCKSGKCSP